ncbi:MAG: hypothetical protein HY756_12660 [Nitrospirae bacterium]|nr:hypothetical protein [Nitrospirota bacterium]
MSVSENRKKFSELIQRWIIIEDNTIEVADDLIKRANNPVVKTFIEIIKLDSEKHKRILESIRLSLDSTVVLSRDDLQVLDTFIERHKDVEKNAIATAEQALEMASLPIPKMLLSHLLEDEKSHDTYTNDLANLKIYMAKSTG